MPTTIDIESQRMFLGSTPVRKIYRGTSLLGMRIAELFANGEQGVWYDPSDFSTMFQDSAGTTPVTAVEQPVGLMLDKSKGLVLGPELVTNGTFDSGLAGWTQNTPGYWVVSGSRAYHAFSTNYNELKWSFTAATSSYQVTLDMEVVSGTAQCFYATNPITTTKIISKGVGVHSISFIVTGGLTSVGFSRQAEGGGAEFYIDNISVRELPGNHASQPTATSRPVLRQDGNGKHYLYFDGVDDGLVTNTITPGIDKVQVFAGVRKLSDVAGGIVAEFSPDVNTNKGSFYLLYPRGGTFNEPSFASRGTFMVLAVNGATSFAAPISSVLGGIGDISGARSIQRVNGAERVVTTSGQGTGNYLAYPLYIGRRGDATSPFNGHLYSLIVRFGANLPAATIEKTEKYINQKTRAY